MDVGGLDEDPKMEQGRGRGTMQAWLVHTPRKKDEAAGKGRECRSGCIA